MAKRGKHQAPEERKIIRLQDYRRAGPVPLWKPRNGRNPSPLRSLPGRKGRSSPRPPWRWRRPRGRKSAGSRGKSPRRCTVWP